MSGEVLPIEAIPRLEEFWDMTGFFGKLRAGIFDANEVERIESLLLSILIDDEIPIPRRFVSLTWWIPTFMEWQLERVEEQGGDAERLKLDIVRLRNVVDSILGVP